MKRILMSGLAASAALFAGCVESTLNPTDTVVVTGKALNEDGSPIADTTLKLHRGLNSTCVLADHFKDLQTDADGAWSHELTGAETQNGELARCFDLRVPATEAGATVNVQFLMQVTEIEAPTLQRWSGSVAVDDAGPGAQVTFQPLSETHDVTAAAVAVVSLEGQPAWRVNQAQSPVAFSEYVLEDFDGLRVQLHAGQEIRADGTRFNVGYQSDILPLAREAKVPVTRGLGCQFGARTFDAGACAATDGRLAAPIPAEAAADFRIDFAQPTKLARMVLRDFDYSPGANVIIEGSTNGGVDFEPLVTLSSAPVEHFTELALDAAAPAVDAFRIRVVGGATDPKILGLRQVSLFE